jgi:hypothetical protein
MFHDVPNVLLIQILYKNIKKTKNSQYFLACQMIFGDAKNPGLATGTGTPRGRGQNSRGTSRGSPGDVHIFGEHFGGSPGIKSSGFRGSPSPGVQP